VPFSLRRQTGR